MFVLVGSFGFHIFFSKSPHPVLSMTGTKKFKSPPPQKKNERKKCTGTKMESHQFVLLWMLSLHVAGDIQCDSEHHAS